MKGIEKDEVMVLGDSFNDYSMFTEFKNSYAMKNAMDEIKKIATYITETNNNDGVGKAIENLLNDDGLVVCEYEFDCFQDNYLDLELIKERKYGYKNIRIYRKKQ